MADPFINGSISLIMLLSDKPITSSQDVNDASISYRILNDNHADATKNDGDAVQPNNTLLMTSSYFLSLNYSTPMMVVIAVVLSVVIIATVFGNLLVGVALFRFRSLRTVSNFLIGNLALSDFLLATAVLPLSTVNECLGHWVFGRAACNVWLLVDVLCCTASLWNICVIALDRYTATLYPIWYRERRSAHQALLYVALVWIISTAVCLPPLLGWNDLTNNYEAVNETEFHRCNLFQSPGYVLYSASMSFFVPFLITVFLYVQIFIVLRKRMRKMRANSLGNGGRAMTSSVAQVPRPVRTAATAVLVSGRQHCDDSRLLLPPEVICADGVTAGTESSMTVIEMATFNATAACSGRRSTDQTSIKSLCSDIAVCGPDDPEMSTAGQPQIDIGTMRTTCHAEGSKCEPDETQAAVNDDASSSNDCVQFVRHVMKLVNRRRSSTDDKDACENSKRFIRREPGANHYRTKSQTATRFDDDCDVKTALMNDSLTSKTTSAAPTPISSQTMTAMQRRRQRLRRFASGSSVFRQSTSSTSTDPRGATLKSSAARRFEQREMQATIRMAIIIAFFCGMWVGFFTVYVLQSWCHTSVCYVPRALEAFFFWLGYSNSSINPILYTIFNDDFRRAFRKLISCQPAAGGDGGRGGRDQLAGSRFKGGGRDASLNMKT